MAINVDISKITGINQVGNSYQRKSAVPLDYYSLFNTKAEAEAYAASNPVSYVGQVISYIHEGEVKVCVIANAEGLLKEVGTKPVGDGKTIEVSAEGAIALLGAASAANGTLPMLEEVDGKSKLVWKTLEQIGAGDGNDNTTYAFSFDNQKITVTPSLNGVAQTAIEIDLSVFATEDEMANAIKDAIDNLPEDKDTTYTLSLSGMELTLTPSEGEAQKVTIDAYNKKEIDDKFAAIPEDKDTTYTAKADDKVLKLTGTEFSTELNLVYNNNRISLTGIDGEEIAGFDASVFVEDGVLQDVDYNAETRELTFTWNIVIGTEGDKIIYKTDVVSIDDLVDVYTAGNGLDLADNAFSVKVAADSEKFLSVDANGVKLSGVQTAIDAAKDAAIEDAKKYEAKADASAVYTKEQADELLNAKANSANVYTKTEADGLLANKANSADVYTKTEADNLLKDKANVADVYAKGETYSQAQIDDLLEGIQAGSSESAASVKNQLDAYKKVVNTEVWGNEEGTGDSRIDTAEAKLAGIAAGAQVNVIESVAVADTENSRLSVSTVGKAVTIDDSGLRTDIANAKKAGEDAAKTASEAVQAAGENANKIQTNINDITNLKTLTGEHTTKISALELADSTHAGEFNALSETVAAHGTDIASLKTGKADTTVTDGLAGRITANENAIKTLNETTIPAINGEIAKKADADKVYTKTEIDDKFAVVDEEIGVDGYGNPRFTRIDAHEEQLKTLNESTIPALNQGISDVASMIWTPEGDSRIDNNEQAIKVLNETTIPAINTEIDEINTLLNTVNSEDSITSLKELAIWVEEHGSEASEMTASIKANEDAIKAIYTPASGEGDEAVAASGVLVTEVARLDKAIADNSAADKKYTDDAIAALQASIHGVDDDTIKLKENKAYVAKVSTDVLVQGETELIFSAGNASGYNTQV